jgi:hypothetical protein
MLLLLCGSAQCPGLGPPPDGPHDPVSPPPPRRLRAKLLQRDAAAGRVLVHYQGYDPEGGPFWLEAGSPRLWLGSYRDRDWKYLVGAA